MGLTPNLSLTAMTCERVDSSGDKTKGTGAPSAWGTGGVKLNRDVSETARLFSYASVTCSAGHQDKGDRILALMAASDLVCKPGWKADWTVGREFGQ